MPVRDRVPVVPLLRAVGFMSSSARPAGPSWYLRSLGDHDTHHGRMRDDGTVLARCGVSFTPRPTLQVVGPLPGKLQLMAGPLALKGDPPDPDQICQGCQHGGAR